MDDTENPIDHQKRWFQKLLAELEKTAVLTPPILFQMDLEPVGFPKWAENVEREASFAMLPAAKLRGANYELTPRRIGALLGHACEKAVWMQEALVKHLELWSHKIENEMTKAEIEKLCTKEAIEKGEKILTLNEKWYNSLRKVAKIALCSCVDQSYEDMSQFLLGGDSETRAEAQKTIQRKLKP